MDRELEGIRRSLEDLLLRVRVLESLEAPMQRQIVDRVRDLAGRVAVLEGFGGVLRAEGIKRQFEEVVEDIHEIKDDQRAIRATVRSALITAAFGIASSIITGTLLYVLLHGGPG